MPDVPSCVQNEVIQLEPRPGTPIGKDLLLFDTAKERVIFHGGAVIARYDIKDRTAEAAVRVLLARSGLVTQVELADAFGVHRNTLGRALRDLETGGMAAVVPAKRGPKGPYKVTPEVLQLVAENAEKALPELIRLLEQEGMHLSRSHVHLLQRRARNAAREQLELMSGTGESRQSVQDAEAPALGAEEAAETALKSELEQPSVEVPAVEPEVVRGITEPDARGLGREPPVRVPEQAQGRYMGASLFFPAIRQLGLLEAALSCFRLPNAELFGVRAVTLTLFFMTVLSRTTVEAAKHLRRWEFGPLIGVVRAPVVKTLRRKLTELIKQRQALSFGQLLLQRWIQQGVVATAYLYVDGHMKAYTGKRELSELYNSQRRLALPGVLNYFVNDQQGRPLLFITEPANASLAKAMPRILEAIRKALAGRPFTIIFDRGGYDSKLFTWLQEEQRIQFITYQQGTPKLPRERFRRHECHFEGRRVRMRLALDEVKVSGSGPWRRIVVLTKQGKQTPILTNVTGTAPAKIACLIFARWRQENFFRYSKEHQGLDQLLGYAWEELDGQTSIPNPELKKLARQLKLKRSQRAKLRERVGQALLSKAKAAKKSGPANEDQTVAEGLAKLEAEIEELNRRRKELPERVPLSTVGERHTLLLQQKAIIDRIKITAYNAEEMLLELLAMHYPNLHDIRDLLRAFCQISGQLRATRQGVQITLDPPDNPTHRRALRGLCADLNQLAPTYPGTDLPLRYDVGVHHAEAAA